MPNWCEGTLKVRGKKENLIKFYSDAFEDPMRIDTETYPDEVVIDFPKQKAADGKTYFLENTLIDKVSDYYAGMASSSSNCGGSVPFRESRKHPGIFNTYFFLRMRWELSKNELNNISQHYGVDIRIHAFEMGMEFEQIFEVHSGKVVEDEVIEYKDKDWEWHCVNPHWGG